ncbi:class II aldolase [Rhodobacteraceae bacterium Araon29]
MKDTQLNLLTPEFRDFSARLGSDSLQVQGPGGNTSIKGSDVMWIKASGTELANAVKQEIFVAVDRHAATKEALKEAGDGSCKATVIDPSVTLRPSIETTFHAALDHAVVAHTHSIATIAHAISPEGREAAKNKLSGLPFALVPYAKPGLPLTQEILARVNFDTRVILLQNHGLICLGATVGEVSDLIEEVEKSLTLNRTALNYKAPLEPALEGFEWAPEGWIAQDIKASKRALGGTYYPDHTVFLGPALPTKETEKWPAVLQAGTGIMLRKDASTSQRAMLKCLSDVLSRVPESWRIDPIGPAAEAELLNWDAEKYRQAMDARA